MAIKDISTRAAAYGMPGITVDGNDVLAVREAALKAIERARGGEGPTLLEFKTYRHYGHFEGDPMVYRSREEEEEWKKRDPVLIFKAKLIEMGVLKESEAATIEMEAKERIKEAIDFAENSSPPKPEDALKDVFTDDYY